MGMKTIRLSLTRVGIEAFKGHTTFDKQNRLLQWWTGHLWCGCRVFEPRVFGRAALDESPKALVSEKPSETNEYSSYESLRLNRRASLREDFVVEIMFGV